jgi:hypothetical protein
LAALCVVASLAGGAAGRARAALQKMAQAAMAVPRSAYPPLRYVYIGRQIYLPRRAAMHHAVPEGTALGGDPLVPLHVAGRSPLATHRMITYRARMVGLY